jgi:hypothetical protein
MRIPVGGNQDLLQQHNLMCVWIIKSHSRTEAVMKAAQPGLVML